MPELTSPPAPAKLQAHARAHQFVDADMDWTTPMDQSMHYLCPTLGPLCYTPSFAGCSAAQQLRYNQLVGLATNEVVGLFERTLQPIVARLFDDPRLPAEMRALLPGFVADEQRHADIWAKLNRLAMPPWYRTSELRMVHLPGIARFLVNTVAAFPGVFPVALWTVLALEEHALEISRRTLRSRVPIEPHFLAAYRLHAQDEARHVQIDWLLLDQLLLRLHPLLLRVNVRMFRTVVDHFLLRPVNVALGTVRQLVAEFPELRPLLSAATRELRNLSTSPAYREMIFSRRSNPITFGLIDRIDYASRIFADLV